MAGHVPSGACREQGIPNEIDSDCHIVLQSLAGQRMFEHVCTTIFFGVLGS